MQHENSRTLSFRIAACVRSIKIVSPRSANAGSVHDGKDPDSSNVLVVPPCALNGPMDRTTIARSAVNRTNGSTAPNFILRLTHYALYKLSWVRACLLCASQGFCKEGAKRESTLVRL